MVRFGNRTAVAAIAFAVAAAVTFATPAYAFFRAGGSATATTALSALGAPGIPSVTVVPGATTAHVSWAPATPPSGAVLGGYRVLRTPSGGATANACGTSSSSPLPASAVACDDANIADGTYTYQVTALFRSWTRTGSASAPVTIALDVDAPTAAVTFPEYEQNYGIGQFDMGCTPTGICGTAADPSGVKTVVISFSNRSDFYWDGRAFTGHTELWLPTTLSAPGSTSTSWSYPVVSPPDGAYYVRVLTTDMFGNTQPPMEFAAKSTMYLDTVKPTVTVAQASTQADPTNVDTAHFTVTFSDRVTGLSGASFVVGGTAPGHASVTVSGTDTVYAVAVTGITGAGSVTLSMPAGAVLDESGNPNVASTSTDNTVTYDPTAPSVTAINFTNGGTSAKADQNDTIAVTFSESLAVASLCPAWSGDTNNQSLSASNDVTVTLSNNSSNDKLTVSATSCTLSLGTISLGSNYASSTATYRGVGSSASTVSWNATTHVLTIKLGALTGSVLTSVAQGKPTYTPPTSPTIKDRAGNALTASFTETSNRGL